MKKNKEKKMGGKARRLFECEGRALTKPVETFFQGVPCDKEAAAVRRRDIEHEIKKPKK